MAPSHRLMESSRRRSRGPWIWRRSLLRNKHTPQEGGDDGVMDPGPTQPMPWCSQRESPCQQMRRRSPTKRKHAPDVLQAAEDTDTLSSRRRQYKHGGLSRTLFAQVRESVHLRRQARPSSDPDTRPRVLESGVQALPSADVDSVREDRGGSRHSCQTRCFGLCRAIIQAKRKMASTPS